MKTKWQKTNPKGMVASVGAGGYFLIVTGDLAKVKHKITKVEAQWLIRSLVQHFI